MQNHGSVASRLPEQVSAMREFNRFYTAKLGLLRRRHLDGDFSLTEARILYEIGSRPKMTASALCGILELDAGYISRLLAVLTRRRLIRQARSVNDGRERLLTLTATGEKAVARLNEESTRQIERILANVSATERDSLITSFMRIGAILGGPHPSPVRIVQLTSPSDDALSILQEYYEAVHVVQRDKPGSLEKILDAPASGMWLAYTGDEIVGCVVLRGLTSIPRAGECKRLYVRPAARGKRIAEKLMDALEGFARARHLEWIYLDTYDDLNAAIALYEKRGYQRCERYNDNPQATLFMRKWIGSDKSVQKPGP